MVIVMKTATTLVLWGRPSDRRPPRGAGESPAERRLEDCGPFSKEEGRAANCGAVCTRTGESRSVYRAERLQPPVTARLCQRESRRS